MPIIIIKVNSGATPSLLKTNPGIDENNKYSMVNAHCAAKITL
jgi:hypothetical protein